ncbi:hypothetical protein EV383_6063 [Pseudonocardia sediminis]|uniref:PPE family protein n=1 Tax=Pseudonocardia sediminis TaxID=1397368 RepID=A0A4Q7V3Y1_PSEST|nr:hypothetical protein [Pseudonocardia sediminis]RZT89106.1 hypothetical protein EV383_6063 [Pseudonocardia sediminis]
MTSVEPERDWAEGSGILSSYKDLGESFGEQDAGGIAAAGTAAGLDTLGLVMDPVGTILAGATGWAIEHVSFLREPLDAMLGDPPEIEARAEAWHLLSLELAAQATAFEGAMARQVAGWEGEAADAYRVAAGRLREALSTTSSDTAGVSETVLTSAAMVGTVRSLIRDMIAGWLGRLVAWLLATVVSGGLAAAAAVPAMVLEATTLALHAAEKISKVVAQLDEASAALATLVSGMGRRADELASIGSFLPASAVPGANGLADTVARAGAAIPTPTVPAGVADRLKNVRAGLEGAAERRVAPDLRAGEPAGLSESAGVEAVRPGWKGAGEGVEELRDDVRVKAAVESGKQAGEARGEIAEQEDEAGGYR